MIYIVRHGWIPGFFCFLVVAMVLISDDVRERERRRERARGRDKEREKREARKEKIILLVDGGGYY